MSRRSGSFLSKNNLLHTAMGHQIGLCLVLLIFCSGTICSLHAYSLPWTWFTRQNGLPEDPVRQVLEDQDGRLLVLTYNEGLFYYDGRQFLSHPANQYLPSLFIQTVLRDQGGRLWFACNYRGIWIYENGQIQPLAENTLFRNQHFTCLYCDSKNRIWTYVNRVGLFLIEEGTVTHLTTRFSLPLEDITEMQEAQGVFYLLSTQGTLQALDLRKATVVTLPDLPAQRIVHFLFTQDSTLLTLEAGRGLVQYEKNGSDVLQPLNINYASRLFKDARGVIWFSLPDYLCCYDRQGKRFIKYQFMEGITPFEDRFHHLWVPSPDRKSVV